MVICGSFMFEFSVSKDIEKNSDNTIFPTYIVLYLLTLIIKELKISVE